jgi:hypothetical protein
LHSIYDLIHAVFQALTWVAIIVAGYLILEAVNDDDEPDGFT